MALSRFVELYEERYNQSITIGELFKMKDIVYINRAASREGAGRTIRLLAKSYPIDPDEVEGGQMQELLRLPYCSVHASSTSATTAAASAARPSTIAAAHHYYYYLQPVAHLPNVIISLRFFKTAVHKLVNDHGGRMPLASFLDCYKCCIYDHLEHQGKTIDIRPSFFVSDSYENSHILFFLLLLKRLFRV